MFELSHVAKSYFLNSGTAVQVLADFSLAVAPGEIVGLMGLSGAGKSTALRLLNRLETASSGSVLFQGVDLSTLSKISLLRTRRKIGMIFQEFNLLRSRTAAANVGFALEIAGWDKRLIADRVDECLQIVGLENFKHLLPQQLSGGQKQRVGIARALATRPVALLADEPTSALDPLTKREVVECLKAINQKWGLTIVVATHEINVARKLCNRVVLLHQGKDHESAAVQNETIEFHSEFGKSFLEYA